jgi:tRNA1Val (adenine37-N6)-methyltransferase
MTHRKKQCYSNFNINMKNGSKYSTEELSFDTLFDGRVVLYQPRKGYRFSVDSPLLTWFSGDDRRCADRCADLGSGCGIIGISLLVAQMARHVVGVEIQPRLADLSIKNARANAVESQLQVLNANITALQHALPSKQFDLVVSNPPFWPVDTGRLPPDEERRIARHEISITLAELVQAAQRLLHPRRGRFCIAFPAIRLEILLSAIAEAHLHTTRIVFVHPTPDSSAELVLLEARSGRAGQLKIAPPLYLKNSDNSNSQIASEILSGAFCDSLRTLADVRTASRQAQ